MYNVAESIKDFEMIQVNKHFLSSEKENAFHFARRKQRNYSVASGDKSSQNLLRWKYQDEDDAGWFNSTYINFRLNSQQTRFFDGWPILANTRIFPKESFPHD